MNDLTRFWFTFPSSPRPGALNLGCGITAYNYEDALALLRDRVFGGNDPVIATFEENVDVSKLDQKHVIPNMGVAATRGVWFPLGY